MATANNELAGSEFGERLQHQPTFCGPKGGRSCTDVLCLLIFIAFLGAWGFIGFYAYTNGDITRIIVPTDSEGLKCGHDSEVVNKPYLVFFNLEKCIDPTVPIYGCPTPQVCVEQCPQERFVFSASECTASSFAAIKQKLICTRDVKMNGIQTCADINNVVENGQCARWYLKSESYLNRCLSGLKEDECPRVPKAWRTRSRRAVADDEKNVCSVNRELSQELLFEKFKTFNMIQEDLDAIAKYFKDVQNFFQAINNIEILANVFGEGQKFVNDLVLTWQTIAVSLLIAMVCCMIVIAMMRWLAAPLLWLSIIGVTALLSFGIYYSQMKYRYLLAHPPARPAAGTNLNNIVNNYMQDKTVWLIILIAACILLFILLLVVLILRKRIQIAIALVKEGSKAVSSTWSTLFFPIIPWIVQVIVITFAIYVLMLLISVGEQAFSVTGLASDTSCRCTGPAAQYVDGGKCNPKEFHDNCHNSESQRSAWMSTLFREGVTGSPCVLAACHVTKIIQPAVIPYFHAANVLGFFWVVFFVSAFSQMVLAATYSTWYWSFRKANVPFFTLTKAVGRTMRYHLGTIAFGSLIISICAIIRCILEYINTKLKAYDNGFTRAVMCCMRCFFWCLERFLRFINKNAYIMCAVHGSNFCSSAQEAFNLLMRNFLRVYALDKVTMFLFFLAKMLVTLGIGCLTYFYLVQEQDNIQMNYPLGPAVVVSIGTYLISTVFFSVYSMAVDTLFLCFLEDCERNDGSAEKPYFMSKGLMKILGNKNEVSRYHYK